MKRTSTLLVLSIAATTAIAAPVALAHNTDPARGGDSPSAHKGKKGNKGHKGSKGDRANRTTAYVIHACVTADATATGVDTRVLSGNRAARRALAGATTLPVKIDADTRVRLVGRAARAKLQATRGNDGRRGWARWWRGVSGTSADLKAGDRVSVTIKAPRGTAAAALPAARKIVDLGPGGRCATQPVQPTSPGQPAA